MTCEDHAKKVERDIVSKSRHPYQPGLIDPALMGVVFRDMTRHWDDIVRRHLNYAHNLVVSFVEVAFHQISDEYVRLSLGRELLDPGLNRMKEDLANKITEVLSPYKDGNPMSWHPELITNMILINKVPGRETQGPYPMHIADLAISERLCHEAYSLYKFSQFTMIDTVNALAVERCLFRSLESLFTPRDVGKMDTATLERLAGEPTELREQRQITQQDKSRLEIALRDCYEYQRRLQRKPFTVPATRRGTPSISIYRPVLDEGAALAEELAAMSMNEQRLPSSATIQKSAPSTPPQKAREEAEVHYTPVPPLTPTGSQSPSPVKPETPKYSNMFTPTAATKTKQSWSRSPRNRALMVDEESEEEDL
jgi:hypothetical protein